MTEKFMPFPLKHRSAYELHRKDHRVGHRIAEVDSLFRQIYVRSLCFGWNKVLLEKSLGGFSGEECEEDGQTWRRKFGVRGGITLTGIEELHRVHNGLDAPKCWSILKKSLIGNLHNNSHSPTKLFSSTIMAANAHSASWRPGLMIIASFSSPASPHLLTSISSNMSSKNWVIIYAATTTLSAIWRCYGLHCKRNAVHRILILYGKFTIQFLIGQLLWRMFMEYTQVTDHVSISFWTCYTFLSLVTMFGTGYFSIVLIVSSFSGRFSISSISVFHIHLV